MSTVYTVNGKVLKNAANDKWLAKKEAPAGFVMNASNVTYEQGGNYFYARWQSPSYPDAYNGNGKQYILVNNNSDSSAVVGGLMYAAAGSPGGPDAISSTDIRKSGTSTGVLLNNVAYPAYGVTFDLPLNTTLEQAQAFVANLTITILDP